MTHGIENSVKGSRARRAPFQSHSSIRVLAKRLDGVPLRDTTWRFC